MTGIGVLSMSKGAEIGLAMACYVKQVVVTVCISGPCTVLDISVRYKNLVITPGCWFRECVLVHVSGAMHLHYCPGNPCDELNQQSLRPVEKARGWILYLVRE